MTQQYTTDYDQSLELLNAGLDRETADYYFKDTQSGRKALEWRGEDIVFPLTAQEVPSWSLAKLWELLNKTGIYYYEYSTGDDLEHVMQSLIYAIERAARKGKIK